MIKVITNCISNLIRVCKLFNELNLIHQFFFNLYYPITDNWRKFQVPHTNNFGVPIK